MTTQHRHAPGLLPRRLVVAALLLVSGGTAAAQDRPRPAIPSLRATPLRVVAREDSVLFARAARVAWRYFERQYRPETGLVNSVAGYPYATMWDIGSGLAGLYCAHRLGLISRPDYDERMGRALLTLASVPLSDGIAFNRNYSTATGRMAGENDRSRAGEDGTGWSATDLGRLLIWLRIIADNDSAHAPAAERVVGRLQLDRVVRDGYLFGARRERSGLRTYREGRIPYEQYAAVGFALWGYEADRALRVEENAIPITVLGVNLLADGRGEDHLTSEPLVLQGLEVGWTSAIGWLARNVLAVQRARYRHAGILTIVSEDALPRPPWYFYYYTINYHGHQFAIATQNPRIVLDSPRWVSAKAALAWQALLPNAYTRLAAAWVEPAADPSAGWSSGVYEVSREPTGSLNVNTAAVILEAALHHRLNGPILATRDRAEETGRAQTLHGAPREGPTHSNPLHAPRP